MTISPGTRLGPYEIVGSLGAGGMGEVYRARDTRLGRDVAIKTLPAAFANDPERRARFETEARAVASLSHPGVLAIHDVGAEGDVSYAVMELVDGRTLRAALEDGPLSASRAMALAIQIAQGLSAAHDRGVIHRDLKPENIMLTPDGHAKILDFGLAKLDSGLGLPAGSVAATVAVSTEPGMVLGTTGYMSPEQVRGEPADARSDLFALGAVMFEMLSGRRAFRGASIADTMSAILREDPPELASNDSGVSAPLEHIVRRCLEKQPAARFRSAADLAYALEAVASGTSGHHARPAGADLSGRPRFRRLTFRNGVVASARFVPDSAAVIFGAAWEGRAFEVFSSHPGSPDARSLGLPPANLLSISSSGELAISLGFRHHFWNQVTGTLARTPLGGGGVRALQKDVGHADWTPDGRSMALVRYVGDRCRLEFPVGQVRLETRDWLSRPRVSRDGRNVAFAYHPGLADSSGEIQIIEGSGAPRVLVPDMISISGIAWSPSGDEVWFSGIHEGLQNGLWGVRLDGTRRDLYNSPARIMLHDVARDGRVLIGLGNLHLGLGVVPEQGARETDLSWFDGSVVSDVSADGRRVVFTEGHEAENPHYACYVRDVDGSPAVRLGDGMSRRMSPDGQWVLAITRPPAHALHVYPTGVGDARTIPLDGVRRVMWAAFHPDGRHVFVIGQIADQSLRLFLAAIGGGSLEPVLDDPVHCNGFHGPAISPDGDRLVMQRASGETLMLTRSSRAIEPVTGLSDGERAIGFDDTGRFLFVAGGEALDRQLHRLDLTNGERTLWRRIVPSDPTGVIAVGDPVVSANGACVAYSYFRHVSDLYLVEGLG